MILWTGGTQVIMYKMYSGDQEMPGRADLPMQARRAAGARNSTWTFQEGLERWRIA